MGTKIQLRRGLKADLPTLDNGEVGFAQDTEELFIGSSSGNKKLTFDATKYDSYDAQLAENAKQIGIGVNKYAKGDGTDETVKVQNALNDGAGKIVIFPYGYSFKVNTLTVPDGTTVFGYGSKIYNTTTNQTILSLGNNVKIFGLEIQGAGNTAYNSVGKAIEIKGIYSTSITYKENVLIENCYIHDFSGYGIYGEYAKHISIKGCKIENIGYAGVGCVSVESVHVANKTHISNITPGTSGNAYGVFFSRESFTDLTRYPRSKDCSVTDCIIENIPLWEALDTHGGENISFMNNLIRNCKVGIAFIAAVGDGGSNLYGAQECTAIGNHIYGIGTGYGIVVQGAAADYANSCIVEGNKLYRCGEQGNDISGAIHLLYTRGLVVQANTLKNCYIHGIHFYHRNYGFSINGNTIVDVQDSSISNVACIGSRDQYNEGVISGNSLRRENTALNTHVSARGINLALTTNTDIVIGSNFNNCTLKIIGGHGQQVKYETYGNGLYRFVGVGTPEGVITADPGSEYININGGAGTTLYVKQSGVGNTGWKGVTTA